jgi:predicted nucleic acid-binding protein
MTNPLVCFDSNFIIWGIKQEATAGQETKIEKAEHVVVQAAKEGKHILIPSVALGEVLSSMPENEREPFVRRISAAFIVVPYDIPAAIHFARMWQTRQANTAYTRNETKADFMIAAIAVANQCECIYSNDDGLCTFATPHIKVLRIEDIVIPPTQPPLSNTIIET